MIRYITVLFLGALFLGSCVSGGSSEPNKLRLAVTIAPTASLIEEIAGERAEVIILLPQGNTPESYEPTPRDLAALAKASAYLYVGQLGFERSWLSRIQELYPELSLISLEGACLHGAQQHNHDPHYWTGIRGIRTMSSNVYEALRGLDPTGDSVYRANFLKLEEKIALLEQETSDRLSTAPSRAFVIFHPSLTDFAEEFGLHQLVIEQDGKEPTPIQLQTLIQTARELGVKTVFIQKEFDEKLSASVAEELGAKQVVINPLGADWAEQLRLITSALSHE
ncbi:MAG: zinc ABC transporter substrate-binding protein [Porphyromonadaceae bacterium]|nr:zinc ABC transporter substrate-binding protein [Porphyromonadaceae bacterium]